MTMVPTPEREKERSTWRRPWPSAGPGSIFSAICDIVLTSSLNPRPLRASVTMRGASSTAVPTKSVFMRVRDASSIDGGTVSALVTTTMKLRTPKRVKMPRCSRVCGMTPSFASTTKRTILRPGRPATIFFINFSCPGTSTIPVRVPSGRSNQAKPKSIVRPRRFSSAVRSVSIPVKAFTRVVLPWSTWPAVPITICLSIRSTFFCLCIGNGKSLAAGTIQSDPGHGSLIQQVREGRFIVQFVF